MLLSEQSDTPKEDPDCVQPDLQEAESQQTSPPTQEKAGKGDCSSRGVLAQVLIQVQVQSQAMKMNLIWDLLFGRRFPRRGPLACLLGRICLLFRDLGLIRSQILGGYNLIYL